MKHIKRKIKKMMGLSEIWTFTLRNIETGRVRVFQYKNLIPKVARTAIANRLTDVTPDNTLLCNYTALGTGTTIPADTDTQLETETYRKTTASSTNDFNIAYITAFYTAEEVAGTFKEAGIFIDGTASANSGVLFSRVAIDITKTESETLTIDYQIVIQST